jgi:hypothetical protein
LSDLAPFQEHAGFARMRSHEAGTFQAVENR